MFSAIKRDGQPLYKLARQGIEVERPSRSVHISELSVHTWQPPDVALLVACSSGTYIRSLAHDLGEVLGCGGHITALRRLAVGDFTSGTAVPLADLTTENLTDHLLPSETAVRHLPRLNLAEAEATRLSQGLPISRTDYQPDAPLVGAYAAGRFIGVVMADQAQWRARKMFVAIDD
jgi:tRNA pseudouridine55 synthase